MTECCSWSMCDCRSTLFIILTTIFWLWRLWIVLLNVSFCLSLELRSKLLTWRTRQSLPNCIWNGATELPRSSSDRYVFCDLVLAFFRSLTAFCACFFLCSIGRQRARAWFADQPFHGPQQTDGRQEPTGFYWFHGAATRGRICPGKMLELICCPYSQARRDREQLLFWLFFRVAELTLFVLPLFFLFYLQFIGQPKTFELVVNLRHNYSMWNQQRKQLKPLWLITAPTGNIETRRSTPGWLVVCLHVGSFLLVCFDSGLGVRADIFLFIPMYFSNQMLVAIIVQ